MNLNTPTKNDFFKPVHPDGLVPHDWDFGFVVKPAQDDVPGKDSRSFLRFYDRAVRDWLQHTAPMNGKKIPVVKATPRRAFAEYDRLLKSTGVLPDTGKTVVELKKFPLPFISMSRTNMTVRQWGFNPFPRRNLAFLNGAHDQGADLKRAAVYSRNPTPVDIPYHIDIWTTYEAQHAWIGQMLLSSFWHKTAHWTTEDPYSGRNDFVVPMHYGGLVDASDLTPDGAADANHRWTLDIIVEGWMLHDLLLAPTVHIAVKEGVTEDGEKLFTQSEVLTTLAPIPLSEQHNTGEAPDSFVDDLL